MIFSDSTSGSCLRDAFRQAGFFLDIPDWYPGSEQLPELCESLGLKLGYRVDEVAKEEKTIACVRTRPGYSHAIYNSDIGPIAKRHNVVAIIFLERCPDD